MASLAVLEEKYGALPKTWVARTASGGLHYYFRGHGKNTVSKETLGEGLDTRGDGGYVVAPPTTYENGEGYTWIHSPDEVELADAPQWLLDLAAKDPEKTSETMITPPPRGSRDGEVKKGARNDSLTRYLGLRRAQGCEYNELLILGFVWNQEHANPPMDEAEVRKTVNSIMRYPIDATRIQRDKDRANVMIVEGINRLAQEGQAQLQQEQIKRVTPEIVEDEPPPLIDWNAYIDDAIATGAVEKIFDESFLAYFLTLWDKDRDAAADLRQRLMLHVSNFDLKGFNNALVALKERMTQEPAPKPRDELPEGAVVAPIDYSVEFIERCLHSWLKESNEMLQQQMLTHFTECQLNIQADMQMIMGLMHSGGLSDTNITAIIETLKKNAQLQKDDEFDIAYRYQFSPMGNAARLAECYRNDHKYCPQEQIWLHYEHGIWNKDADEACIK
jgi:hypothetical protein